MFEPILSPMYLKRRPKYRYLRQSFLIETSLETMEEDIVDSVKDSGIVEDCFQYCANYIDGLHKGDLQSSVQSETNEIKQLLHVPVDILITGGNMSILLYQFEIFAKSKSFQKSDLSVSKHVSSTRVLGL